MALAAQICHTSSTQTTTTTNYAPTPPNTTSGIRLGTAAVATRGMQPSDMDQIAGAIDAMVADAEGNRSAVLETVRGLTERYPLYPGI